MLPLGCPPNEGPGPFTPLGPETPMLGRLLMFVFPLILGGGPDGGGPVITGGGRPLFWLAPSQVPISMLCLLAPPTTGGGSTPGFLLLEGGGGGLAG